MIPELLGRNVFFGNLFIIKPVYKVIFTSLNEKDSLFLF